MCALSLSACRVCLASDREMYRLANTALEETYERVTSGMLVVEGRPCCVCGVCLFALRRCRRFIDTAREANDALDRWIRNQPNTDTVKLTERPLFSFTQTPMEVFEVTCQEGIWEPGVKQGRDTTKNEDIKMISQQNEGMSDVESNILTEEIKYEVTSDDESDKTHVSDDDSDKTQMSDNIENHSSVNYERVDMQEEMIDIEMDSKTLDDVKINSSESSDNVGGDTAPGTYNIGRNHPTSSQEDVPLQRSQKRVKTNEDSKKNKDNKVQTEDTSDDDGVYICVLTEETKYQVSSVDGSEYYDSDETQMSDNIENHSSVNYERVDMQEEMIDTKTSAEVKINSSELLENVGGDTALGTSNVGRNRPTREDVPLQSRKRVKPNEDSKSGPALQKRRPITSEHRRGNTDRAAELYDKLLLLSSQCSDNSPKQKLIQKLLKKHAGVRRFACDKCDYKCKAKRCLEEHLRRHTDEKPFACDKCEYKSSRKVNLQRHSVIHTGEKPFACDKCDYKSHFKSNLKQHSLIHTGENLYMCDMCGYKCTKKPNLRLHIKTHTGENQFSCDMCDYKTLHRAKFKRHLIIHYGTRPLACDKCDYQCMGNSLMKRHLMTHTGEKPFACDKCDFKFRQNCHLKRHLVSHTGAKPYVRDKCSLKRHSFVCDMCGFQCSFKTKLKLHLLTHTGEKPFACDVCDFKTMHSFNLKRHLMTHTGEKPFACDKCDYKCREKFSLKQHSLTHTGEKPYMCDKCDYKCTEKRSLCKHIKKFHAAST